MTKAEILKNIDDLSEQQLYEAICEGVVTMDDLKNSGELGKIKRDGINKLLKSDDDDWNAVQQTPTESAFSDYLKKHPKGKYIKKAESTIEELKKKAASKADDDLWATVDPKNQNDLNEYLQKFPEGVHAEEANKAISEIKQEKDKVLKEIENLHPSLLLQKIKNGVLSWEDLKGHVDQKFIDYLKGLKNPDDLNGVTLQLPSKRDPVTEGQTEVYFWGVPGSGKTCALGSVLATANKNGYLTLAKGSGYGYATQLKNIFKVDGVSILPPPTSEDSTQYLPIKLVKDGKTISVSILEVAGEVFKDYHRLRKGDPFSPNHPDLGELLTSPNRKIHFFFVDYSLKDRVDNDNVKQSDYLQAAASYFEENDIFSKNTDAIYLVVTKSDMMDRNIEVKSYSKGPVCASLTNALKEQCKKNHINGENLIGLKFSIGKVSMGGKLCIHDSTTSENILDILFRKVPEKK